MGCKYNSSNIPVGLKIGRPTGLKHCKDSFLKAGIYLIFDQMLKCHNTAKKTSDKQVKNIHKRQIWGNKWTPLKISDNV